MKKSLLIAVALLVVSAAGVSAEMTTGQQRENAGERAVIYQERTEKREQMEADRDVAREAKTEELQDQRRVRVEEHAERVENRFKLYSQRFEKIIQKMRLRMEKMQERGIDTSAAESSLVTAEAALDQAETLWAEAVSAILAVSEAESVDEAQALRAEAKTAVEAVRSAYKAVGEMLKDTLQLLKDATVAANTATE